MIKVLEDDNLRQKMIKEWLEFSQQFSWKNTAKKFDELIESLIK
jgi:glycosyltransferase involved in cell wall biosynthesis